ncbi:MAG: ferrochelatase [Phycisphaerales bacterium]|nr:ferrochelatase [Phycisphaerales bacterium]
MHSITSTATVVEKGAQESRRDSSLKRGVLLVNLGTPDRADVPAVRRYLAEFLSDPEVIRLPARMGWMNKPLGRLIAWFRAPRSAEMYRRVWTQRGSPLMAVTQDQASALEAVLPPEWRVFYAMRYGQPSIGETVREIEASGVEDLVVIPMYPQFSGPTTRTALGVLYKELERCGHRFALAVRTSWFDDGGYIDAQAGLIEECAESEALTPGNAFLLFSAHSLPVSYVQRGDPYTEHVARTIELVRQRLEWPADRCSLAFQSRFGPVEWLGPQTDDVLMELARSGERRVVVCPISFTADCLETLEEIGLRYRDRFEETGGKLYLCPALNTFSPFIAALKNLVLRGPNARRTPPSPLFLRGKGVWNHRRPLIAQGDGTRITDADIDSFVMVGASVRGRMAPGRGPDLVHIDQERLCSVKRSQCEAPALLRTIRDSAGFSEAWLWNTCHRFELYGWTHGSENATEQAQAVADARRSLFGDRDPGQGSLNVLYGRDAWRHLLRTAAGLNSSLPGERDILEQLEAAHRLAHCAGTTGPRATRVLAHVLEVERRLRCETDWGHFAPDHCFAALARIVPSLDLDNAPCRAVVIGGSTTSAALLRTLTERFDVPSSRLTLLYRGHKHGGQIKLLRKAIGNGRRIRVQSYGEPRVTRILAGADVVFFGIDHREPVLHAEQLRGCRDFESRPLTIIDFNTFGSTSGLETLEGVSLVPAELLEAEAEAFADQMCATPHFAKAVEAAERFIQEHVERSISTALRDGRPIARNPTLAAGAAERCAAHSGDVPSESCPRRTDIAYAAMGRQG